MKRQIRHGILLGMLALVPSAAPANPPSAAPVPGVGVNLAVTNLSFGEEGDMFPGIQYSGDREGDVLKIRPQLVSTDPQGRKTDYLRVLADGGLVMPVHVGSPEYNVGFPELDIRVVNNSGRAIHLSRVDLDVASSRHDNSPLPYLLGGYHEVHHVNFINDGWQRVEKVDFEFDLVAAKPAGKPAGPLPFKRSLHRVERNAELHLHDELVQKGVPQALIELCKEHIAIDRRTAAIYKSLEPDGEFTEAMASEIDRNGERQGAIFGEALAMARKGLGPFKLDEEMETATGWLHGWMTLHWNDDGENREMRLAVACPVLLIPPEGLGAPGPETGNYDVMLRDEGSDYAVRASISQIAGPGAITRFKVALGVPRTGTHRFGVRLVTTDGTVLDAGKVELNALLPPLAKQQLLTAASRPAE